MHPLRRAALVAAAIAVALLVAACSDSTGAPPATLDPLPASGGSAPTPIPSASVLSGSTEPVTSPPPSAAPAIVLDHVWAMTQLVDVATGDTFRIADHAGQVILVETMAIWCSNCLSQQKDVQEALARLEGKDVVFVVLDVDPNEDGPSLARYQARNDFSGLYAVAGSDLARALAADFGDQFLNPPSTPMLVIGTDGTVTRTDFGHKSVDELVSLARAHGA